MPNAFESWGWECSSVGSVFAWHPQRAVFGGPACISTLRSPEDQFQISPDNTVSGKPTGAASDPVSKEMDKNS